jgi:hypothetical protein
MIFRVTLFGALFSMPWIFNAWRSRKHITQSIDSIQIELLDKDAPEVKPYTLHLIIGLILMITPIIVCIALGIEEHKIGPVIIGIWIGSLLSCPWIWGYQQSKYPGTGYSGDSFHTGCNDYSAAARSQSNFDETFSPAYKNFAQNIYHNRHY